MLASTEGGELWGSPEVVPSRKKRGRGWAYIVVENV